MKKVIIEGSYRGDSHKKSSIAKKVADLLNLEDLSPEKLEDLRELAKYNLADIDLLLWMPDIPNEEEKVYPIKKQGAILILSKVIREGYDLGEAVSRIFKMHGNACIAIKKTSATTVSFYEFNLIDALGNSWTSGWTIDLKKLSSSIEEFVKWANSSVRMNSLKVDYPEENAIILEEVQEAIHDPLTAVHRELLDFCQIVRKVADLVEKERGGRYFGNASTRCARTFSTMRQDDNKEIIIVSGRNVAKDRLQPTDFVATLLKEQTILFSAENKPSVDTPIQLQLYQKLPRINYMIHGHAHIEGYPFTEHYVACGDLNEVNEILHQLYNSTSEVSHFALNLKNHGFLIGSHDLKTLEEFVNTAKFNYRHID